MTLKAIVESVEGLSEDLKSQYVEKDGKFVLDVEPVGGFALEDVSGLKSALGKERTQREAFEKDVVAFKGLDPVTAREAMEKLAELENIDPAKDADKLANEKFEAAKKQLLAKHNLEIEKKGKRERALADAVSNLMIDQVATAALAEAKGSVKLLLPHIKAAARVKEDVEGNFAVEVIDSAGNARIGNSKGDMMTIKDLVSEMSQSDTFAPAFEADGTGGGGTPPGSNSGGAGKKITAANFAAMGAKERAEAMKNGAVLTT